MNKSAINKVKKFKELASGNTSRFVEKAKTRKKQRGWLDFSFKIAVFVLRTLRQKGISQKQLAEKLRVTPQRINTIIKGQENLSLETIYNLSAALGVDLIKISTSESDDVMQVPNPPTAKPSTVIKSRSRIPRT